MAIKKVETDLELIGYGKHHFENLKIINDNFTELAGTTPGGDGSDVLWSDIKDKPAVIAAGADAAAARTAIGAGTSNLAIGTTAATAKAGNYVPTFAEITGKPATFAPTIGTTAVTALAGNTPLLTIGTTATTALAGNTVIPAAPTWANISGKPAVVAAGVDAAAARTAIGAGTGNGTSNLALGTTTTTAATGKSVVDLQAALTALEARVATLEGAGG